MHLDFRVKPENDRKDTFGTSPCFLIGRHYTAAENYSLDFFCCFWQRRLFFHELKMTWAVHETFRVN